MGIINLNFLKFWKCHKLDRELASALELARTLTLTNLCSEERKLPKTLVLMWSVWMNWETSERRQKQIINKTLSSSVLLNWPGSRTQQSSNQKNKDSKRKNFLKSKNKLLWPSQRQERPKWLKWISKEHPRSSQKDGRSKKNSRVRLFCLKPRKNLMKI